MEEKKLKIALEQLLDALLNLTEPESYGGLRRNSPLDKVKDPNIIEAIKELDEPDLIIFVKDDNGEYYRADFDSTERIRKETNQ